MARRPRAEEEALRPKEKKLRGGDMLDVNPGIEDKAEFRKITVTIPPDAYEQLIYESARRKIAGKPNQLLSSLLREAVVDYLKRLEDEKSRSDYSAVQA
jgi:hypothetical protein